MALMHFKVLFVFNFMHPSLLRTPSYGYGYDLYLESESLMAVNCSGGSGPSSSVNKRHLF